MEPTGGLASAPASSPSPIRKRLGKTLPEVAIEIAPLSFTEWAKGAAVIAFRSQIDAVVRRETAMS